MTLKEEFEVLRGAPIRVFQGDPMDIPCIETSDSEKLCAHPLVSVHMITYNHGPYIRQAIEGVMMQQTDFEFELVIGEDASTDRTREICFEYQRRFPDKVRVLWWHENLSRHPHPAGGNGKQVTARCRGEFIAFCEGDDYWTDPLKLQRQVDVMRRNPGVGLCFCGADVLMQEDGKIVVEGYAANGLLKGREFFGSLIADVPNPMGITLSTRYLHTPTALVRKSVLALARQKYRDIFQLALSLGDTTLWYAISSLSDVYYLPNITAVYRVHAGGVSVANRGRVMVDANLVRALFLKAVYKVSDAELIQLLVDKMIFAWLAMQGKWSDVQAKKALEDVSGLPLLGQIFRHPRFRLFRLPFVARAKALIVRKVAFYFFFHFMKDGNCANMFKRYDLNSRWTTEG